MLRLRLSLYVYVCVIALVIGTVGSAHADAANGREAAELAACRPKVDNHPVIKAYRASGRVRDRLSPYAKRGWKIGCVFMTGIGSVCGVAGCDQNYLVGARVSRPGVNPQSHAILARVSYNLFTQNVSPVRLVQIAPSDAMIIRAAASLACPREPGWETTAGMRKCRERQLRQEKTRLTGLVARLKRSFRSAPGADDREKSWSRKQAALFGKSQNAWKQYRNTVCAAAYHETYPGSFASLRRLECLFRVTNTRAQELHRLYDFK